MAKRAAERARRGRGARVGAAAVVLGFSLAGPQATGVAAADATDADSPTLTAGPASESGHATTRPGRARRPGAHAKGNPLATLAMESTIMMIMCFPLAYGASLVRPEWFFPAMMMIIGGRFLLFATMYGMKTYWICGATLGIASWLLFKSGAPLPVGAFTGMTIEASFSIVIYCLVRKDARPD